MICELLIQEKKNPPLPLQFIIATMSSAFKLDKSILLPVYTPLTR